MVKIVIAASAITFAVLLVLFVIVLFTRDIHAADRVWQSPIAFAIWAVSLLVCSRLIKSE